ncbi:hypothetical protein [Escherichia whittamii]|uniref:hypothetical protein n=1 Tax=Escherichia whittamii TaxID=2762229 RepID=UPI002DBC7ED6|nr:hypothetical protein [Escherichia whittamii]MEB7936063.1 hypothetical protein [Escherichia whittamii]
MYIPSSFLYDIIRSERIGVFCESNSQGHRAIVAKLPTSTIKAIALGAKVELYAFINSQKPHYLALCMKVFDNKSSPLHAVITQRWNNSNNLLDISFFDTKLNLVLFDETDIPIQGCKIKIVINSENKCFSDILEKTSLKSADNYAEASNFMDSVCSVLGFDYNINPDYSVMCFKFPVEIIDSNVIKIIHVNHQGATHYDLVQDIDGVRQERQIYQSLCLMNNSKTIISPFVTIGKKERELTDVLTITKDHKLIAVESKCLQVDSDAVNKSYDRTATSIIKHCKKGLGQLEGVFKTLKRGEKVYDNNKILILNRDFLFYGIVLIDEYRHSESWSEIINLILMLRDTHGICLNVISLSEMMYIIKLCKSDTELFIKSLDYRYRTCIRTNTIDIQFKNSALPEF